MKVKIFALVAAFFMLMGGSAWAQSDVKGDVNKDGVVNEQDIAAILAIMQEAGGVKEQTKYYWYVGYDNQGWFDNDSQITTSNTLLKTTTTNSFPTTWSKASANKYTMPGTNNDYIVALVPKAWGLPVLHNPAGGTIGLGDLRTITFNGMEYLLGWTDGHAVIKEIYLN